MIFNTVQLLIKIISNAVQNNYMTSYYLSTINSSTSSVLILFILFLYLILVDYKRQYATENLI